MVKRSCAVGWKWRTNSRLSVALLSVPKTGSTKAAARSDRLAPKRGAIAASSH
jgi:hypothetical protein